MNIVVRQIISTTIRHFILTKIMGTVEADDVRKTNQPQSEILSSCGLNRDYSDKRTKRTK
jgi:hypothetical protein